MKNILLLVFVCSSLFSFSQGKKIVAIDWIPLEKAKEYAKKYDKTIFIYFYKEHCPYCEAMKKETFNDITVINLINNNFFPVKINTRTKDTIHYNGKDYSNQQPISDGSTWRHDFYAEVATFKQQGKEMATTPTIALFNNKFEKIKIFPGKQSKQLLLRRIKDYVK
jgi:thioredoxin-related protein